MSGWKQLERDVANYLGERIGIDVKTGRNSAAAGRQSDSDLWWTDDNGRQWPGIQGVTIECKYVQSRSVPKWLTQAREAAVCDANDWWVVVWKDSTRGVRTATEDATVFVPTGMIHDYLQYGEPRGDYSPRDYHGLSLAAFTEVWW